jgi:hypothetical protein
MGMNCGTIPSTGLVPNSPFGNGKVLSINNDPLLQFPTLCCFDNPVETADGPALTCVTDEQNQNLTNLQKIVLQWHFKLGHIGFQT